MATIGTRLTAVEDSSWKRIELENYFNTSYVRLYPSASWSIASSSDLSNGSALYGPFDVANQATINFRFKGTKIRFITYGYASYDSNNTITIDGVTETFSCAYSTGGSTFVYEKTGLTNTNHTVKIQAGSNGSYHEVYGDAIDIDSDGELLIEYTLADHNKKAMNNFAIGDYVWCRYAVATANTIGTFSDIGTKTDADISTALRLSASSPSSTLDGYFRFIVVGYTYDGKVKMVADRPVQYTTFTSILDAGMANTCGVPITIDSYSAYMRILTGGINGYNATTWETDNEWDQILTKSTLNGLISAGDSNIWNFLPLSYWEWVSTTYSSTDSIKVRGTSTGSTSNSDSSTSGTYNFRPVLLIDAKTAFPVMFRLVNNSIYAMR